MLRALARLFICWARDATFKTWTFISSLYANLVSKIQVSCALKNQLSQCGLFIYQAIQMWIVEYVDFRDNYLL